MFRGPPRSLEPSKRQAPTSRPNITASRSRALDHSPSPSPSHHKTPAVLALQRENHELVSKQQKLIEELSAVLITYMSKRKAAQEETNRELSIERNRRGELTKKIEQFQDEFQTVSNNDLNEAETEHHEAIQKIKRQRTIISEKEQHIASLKSKIQILKNNIVRSKEQLVIINTEIAHLKEQHKSRATSLSEFQQQLKLEENREAELESQIEQRRLAVKTLEGKKNALLSAQK